MLENYKLIAKGLTTLFSPLTESVIHDLKSNKIVFIDGKESVRKVGESSYLTKKERELSTGILGPYMKTDHNGFPQKSISIILGEEGAEHRYMMCLNFNVSKFQEIETFLKTFLGSGETKKQENYFNDNWQDKIHNYLKNYLSSKKKIIENLTREEKKDLTLHLHERGAFEGKNAASYIANILKISRATVYSYLKN